jgi:hypothetical protein
MTSAEPEGNCTADFRLRELAGVRSFADLSNMTADLSDLNPVDHFVSLNGDSSTSHPGPEQRHQSKSRDLNTLRPYYALNLPAAALHGQLR